MEITRKFYKQECEIAFYLLKLTKFVTQVFIRDMKVFICIYFRLNMYSF